jgi:small GTP-binding protein
MSSSASEAPDGNERASTLIKVIIIGDSSCGKSCLLRRLTDNSFADEQAQTIGVEFGAKVVTVLGRKVKLQVWDTAGQERYRSVTRSYYRGAMACLLVYDITRTETFEHVAQWLEDARRLADRDVTIVLVGNKSDLAAQRSVPLTEASVYAQQNNMLLVETSAATGDNVEHAFILAAKNALQKMQQATEGGAAPGGNTLLSGDDRSAEPTLRERCCKS